MTSNHTKIFSIKSPYNSTTIRSNSQLQYIQLKRLHPRSLKFDSSNPYLNKRLLKTTFNSLTKHLLRLKNPPVKPLLSQTSLAKYLRALEVKPDEAKQYIVPISHRFLRLNTLTISNEGDLFSPIRIKKKARPMMLLRKFNYDHEFCKDFMKCARYVRWFKIRKTSLDFNQLKRMKKLQHFYLNLK